MDNPTALYLLVGIAYIIMVDVPLDIPKTTRDYIKKVVKGAVVLIAIPICMNEISSISMAEGLQPVQRDIKDTKRIIAEAALNNCTNTEFITEFVNLKYERILLGRADNIQNKVKKIFESEGQYSKDYQELDEKTKDLSNRLEYKWKQLVVTIINKDFDVWVEQLQKQGELVKYEKKVDDFDVVIDVDKTKYWEQTIRKIRFPNGNAISINFGPGQIQRGKFLQHMNINFQEVVKERYQSAFIVWYHEDYVRTYTSNNRYRKIEASSRNPMEDEKFLDTVSGGIEMIFKNMMFFKGMKMDNQ